MITLFTTINHGHLMADNRPEDEKPEHDEVVCAVARDFDSGDLWELAVDADCAIVETLELPEFNTYPAGCGDEDTRVPDVYAQVNDSATIVEVETQNTVDLERTRCQLSTFNNIDDTIVVVPEQSKSEMGSNLEDWDLTEVTIRGYS